MKNVRSALTRSSLGATKSHRSVTVLAGLALGAVLAVGTAVPASAASLPSTDRIYAYECGEATDFRLLEIQADGTATAIGTGIDLPGDQCPAQSAWDPVTQKAYFVLAGNVYSTDLFTGVSTVVTTTSGAAGNTSDANNYLLVSPSLAIAPDGTAWVLNLGYVGTIDLATGLVTEITADPNTNPTSMEAFAYNGADSKLYTIDADDKTDDGPPLPNELLTVGQTTGAVTLGTGVPIQGYQDGSIENLFTMAFDSSGRGWIMDSNSSSQLKSFDTAGAVVDQGAVLIGASAVSYCSMFIATPSSGGGGGGGGWSPVDDGYLDYQRGRVEGEGSTDLPDTGGSANALNVIVGLGCLAVGSTLVAASRRRRYS
jgi:LPXTG-motif cell wall-anchored protein